MFYVQNTSDFENFVRKINAKYLIAFTQHIAFYFLLTTWASLVDQMVTTLPAVQET